MRTTENAQCSQCNYGSQMKTQCAPMEATNTVCPCPPRTFTNHDLLMCQQCRRCQVSKLIKTNIYQYHNGHIINITRT